VGGLRFGVECGSLRSSAAALEADGRRHHLSLRQRSQVRLRPSERDQHEGDGLEVRQVLQRAQIQNRSILCQFRALRVSQLLCFGLQFLFDQHLSRSRILNLRSRRRQVLSVRSDCQKRNGQSHV
jgi:hypothetical protein